MQALKLLLRITRLLGKAILGLLLILFTIVALVHLPPVQQQITNKLSNYLSAKIEAKVEIQRISFSILGNVAIDDITVWDPNETKIFSAQKIEVATSIPDLVSGNFSFDEVHIAGMDWQLIQRKDGLNIQFIIDAFKPKEKKASTKSNPILLQFKYVSLENIHFEYTSMVSDVSVEVNLGTFKGQQAEFSTNPIAIKADQASLQHTVVNVLSAPRSDAQKKDTVISQNRILISPDFGTGLVLDFKDLELKDDHFSFHQGQVTDTQKFDPSHISLNNIQLSMYGFLMREDTLAAGIQALSAQLPGITIDNAKSDIKITRHELVLSRLHLASGNNELQADLTAPNDLNSAKDDEHVNLAMALKARINPQDLAWFLSDSILNRFNHWGPTQVAVEGNYSLGKGEIQILQLKTENSLLHAEGMVNDAFDLKKISWKELVVNASIGSDFKKIITPLIRNINIPPHVTLRLKSTGDLKKLHADATIFTTWGDVKATGRAIQYENNIGIALSFTGEKVDLAEWLNLAWIGPMDMTAGATGTIGTNQFLEINGLINNIEIQKQAIHDITFQSIIKKDSANVTTSIRDPNFRSEISSEISFAGPLLFSNLIQLDSFKIGSLLHIDSTLAISAYAKSDISIDQSGITGNLDGKNIIIQKQSREYLLDTIVFRSTLSSTGMNFKYYTDNAQATLVSNFGIEDSPKVLQSLSKHILRAPDYMVHPTEARTFQFNIEMENESLFKLLGIDVDNLSSLRMKGEFDEQKQLTTLQATTGKFKGYGISLDTLDTHLSALHDSLSLGMNIKNLRYDSIPLGNLDFDIHTQGDTSIAHLLLANDTMTYLSLQSRIYSTDSGTFFFPDKVRAINNDYFTNPKNPVFLQKDNIAFNNFIISRDDMEINLNGDLNYFDIMFKHVDLTPLNFLLSSATTVINKGHLTGNFSYSSDQQLDVKVGIDSLSLYNSNPLTLAASAVSDGNQIPFEFLLTNESNKVDLNGKYFKDNTEVDANLQLDVNNLELFSFLVDGFIEQMKGTIKGGATIHGPIKKPAFKGSLRFLDMGLTTVNPKLTFKIQDDSIALDNSSLVFNQFTLYDKDQHPLTISGNLTSKDYQSLAYDLNINSDQYTLINNPDSTSGKLRGLLVIDSDIKLKGNQKDTRIEANLTIKDATDLTFITSEGDIEMLKVEGIVDFIDPTRALDSTAHIESANLYDSLIASLPEFNLNSKVSIEDKAVLRVVIDEQSGDYIEASGGANLELGYDRSGNLSLAGNYTIKKGVYRLSFYDLVKKNFNLVQGSVINWSGSPKNGDLSIKATHTVESNSLGLIGHEIGENEKSIYKRSLDYEVGININGTIEKPIISFSLDLPQNEKVNYPVLSNKLDRLRQPEYASELNKQVFGLLVLGGFLPESSADVNSSVIATTALSNSVNSLLASQLNRFANQYIKGVNIDVGIQSFSDYSAPGGKTQTAMDFRVSKKIMNDRMSFEIGGDFDINQDQSGGNTGKNYRGDIAIIYDLTGNGDKQLKLFNNETYDIIYQEIRNTGISLIFIREFSSKDENKKKNKN